MNIDRNEVTEFHYSSTAPTTGEFITPALGTASGSRRVTYRITDLKATVGGTGRTLVILGKSNFSKALNFDLPANTLLDMHWEIPYRISVLGSTGQNRGLIASASGAGVKYSISGYIE